MATPDDEREITMIVGQVLMMHPDLIERASYEQIRQAARDTRIRRGEPIPAAFIRAFEGE